MSGRSVLLWVVVPFGVLCALGLWLTRPVPPPPPAPEPPPEAPPRLVTPPMPGASAPVMAPPAFPSSRGNPALLPVGPAPAAEPTPAEEDEALVTAASVDPVVREELRTALRATRRLIDECFSDFAERHPGEQRATLRFRLGREGEAGHLDEGQVVDTTVQHPVLRACLEDSLLDAQFPAPRRGEGLTLTWPYRFRPPTPLGGSGSPGAAPTGR